MCSVCAASICQGSGICQPIMRVTGSFFSYILPTILAIKIGSKKLRKEFQKQ